MMAAVVSLPEQKIILKGVSWETDERLLAEHHEQSGIRFTYDCGMLEMMTLSARHEKPNRILASLVEVVAEEMQIDLERLGSVTLQRPDLHKGFEPDSCFYIQRLDAISGKEEIDLLVDPPPDLVTEVDITPPALDTLPLYAAVGVPEIWRYDGERVTILRLQEERYIPAVRSLALPPLNSEMVTQFLHESRQMRSISWLRQVRAWARTQMPEQ